MKTPGIALTAALGFFIFWGVTPLPAQRYQPEKWEACSDPELAAAFEKLTGQKAWKVKWQTGSREADPAKPPENRSRVAWVLGPPKKTNDRISEGVVEYFYLGIKGHPATAWSPGEQPEWRSARVDPNPPQNQDTRYVFAKAPAGESPKGIEGFARRIYEIPIFADPELSAKECLALIDATYQLGISALTSPELRQGISFWDEDRKPSFGSLAGITAKDPLKFFPRDTPHPEERRMVFLSEGGDGGTILVYRWRNGEAHLETSMGLSF